MILKVLLSASTLGLIKVVVTCLVHPPNLGFSVWLIWCPGH